MWYVDDFVLIPGQTPLTSWKFIISISLIHWIISYVLEKLMNRRSEPINVRRIQRYNNLFTGMFSAIIFVCVHVLAYRDGRFTSWDRLVCHRPTPRGAYALLWYIFYLSKIWEFWDIYFVILNKTPVLGHFRWHHQTTPSVVFAGLLGDVSYEWPMIVSNTLMHTFLYPHLAGIWRVYPILVVLGAWQLIVGLGLSIYGFLGGCDGAFYAQLWGLFMYITYTLGYLNEHFHLVDRFLLYISKFRRSSKMS